MTSAFANSQFAAYDVSYAMRTPYLDTNEFQNSPQALDLFNLLPGGNPAVQLQALQETIGRASSWMDQYCCGMFGTLCATQNTETARIWMGRDYTLKIHPKYQPVLSVDAFSFSPVGTPFGLAASVVPAGNVWIEPQEFVVNPFASGNFSGNGLNTLGYGYGGGGTQQEYYCTWVYTNGWPNTTLAASVAAGATSIQPLDVTGIYPGTMLTLYDLPYDEPIQVSSTYVPGSSVVPFAIPLSYNHGTTATVTNLPPAVKQAAVWATCAMIKQRGSGALIMEDMGATTHVETGDPQNSGSDWWRAEELLLPFKQNWVGY